MMMKCLALIAPLVALAAPVFAEPSCEAGGKPLPMWQVAKTFEDAGGAISNMKVNNGCYEIYGKVADKKVEVFFDPVSGAEIGRE